MVDVPKNWLVPLLVALSVSGGGTGVYAITDLSERIATLEAQHAEMARRMEVIDGIDGRLTRIETLLELAIEKLGIMGRGE